MKTTIRVISVLLAWSLGAAGAVAAQDPSPPGSKSSGPAQSASGSSATAAGPSLICVDPLVKVFRDAADLPPVAAEAHAAVGEVATIQFVFRSPVAVKDLRASVSGDAAGAAVRFVGYVKVGHSYKDAPPDVLRSADRTFPDPLLEDKGVAVAAGQNQPVWITVAARAPGALQGVLALEWSGGRMQRPFVVRVHNVRMQKPRLWVTNWWSMAPEQLSILAGHKVEADSEESWRLVRQIADFMARYHQNVAIISPLELARITRKDGKWAFDFARFDRMVETFRDAGVIGRIEGGHIGDRASDEWEGQFAVRVPEFTNGTMRFVKVPAKAAAARGFYGPFFSALAAHLAARGWDKIYVQHLADEPIDGNAASYRDLAGLVHEFAPGMRTIEAVQTHNVVGAVDVWVPILDQFHHDYDFLRNRQKAGDEVWFYTCCRPTGAYANRFIEQPLIKTRLLHWINFRYGATGYLHWGFNWWNAATSPFGETTFRWPGGDQWIVYPKDGKLLSSIRLEAMRDGIADYELLSMLAHRNPAAAERMAGETVLGFERYDSDVARFRARRLKLLEALEK